MSYVEHCKKHGQYHGEICGECYEELKEQNERLEKQIKVMDKCFAAEIAELNAENAQLQEEYKKLFEQAKVENARLREALEFIRSGCLAPPDGGSPCLDDAISAARAALEGK
jgi:predicted transcriptional regulator